MGWVGEPRLYAQTPKPKHPPGVVIVALTVDNPGGCGLPGVATERNKQQSCMRTYYCKVDKSLGVSICCEFGNCNGTRVYNLACRARPLALMEWVDHSLRITDQISPAPEISTIGKHAAGY